MSTFCSIVINIVSEFAFLAVAAVLSFIIFRLTHRRKLFRFYGVSKPKRIVVYLSHLGIVRGGAIGIDGETGYSYHGSSVVVSEAQTANRFRDQFNYPLPSLSDNPGLLGKLLISDAKVDIQLSPAAYEGLERVTSFVTFGSPAYNIASRYVEEKLHSRIRFELGRAGAGASAGTPMDDAPSGGDPLARAFAAGPYFLATGTASEIEIDALGPPDRSGQLPAGSLSSRTNVTGASLVADGQGPGPTVERPEIRAKILLEGLAPITDTRQAFVERLVLHQPSRSIFYVAGLSELGTAGAAHFLFTKWGDLYRKYGDDISFVVVLQIGPTDYRNATIIAERELSPSG